MTEHIRGFITSVKKIFDNNLIFIKTEKDEICKCSVRGFFIGKEGDLISFKGVLDSSGCHIPDSPPLVLIPCTEKFITESISKSMKSITQKRSLEIYKNIADRILSENPECENVPMEVEKILNIYSSPDTDKNIQLWGLNKKEFSKLMLWWWKNINLRKFYLLGFNRTEIKDLAKEFEYTNEEIYNYSISNPFIIPFISLEKATNISNMLGQKINKKMLFCGSIVRKIAEFMKNGSIGIPKNIMMKLYPDLINDELKEYKIIYNEQEEMYYLDFVYKIQLNVSKNIRKMIYMNKSNIHLTESSDLKHISYTNFDKELSEEQIYVVKEVLKKHISIITARAGRGKTRVIKEIVKNLKSNGQNFLLCSFTGKAVGKIKEVCCEKAYTIDRIMVKGLDKKYDYVIIDEISMVRTKHIYKLINLLGINVKFIMIGDSNQLPPIGYGNFFREIMINNKIPVYKMTECFRNQNGILKNADMLLDRQDLSAYPKFEEGKGFYMFNENIDFVQELLKELKNKNKNYDSITVLSPIKRCIDEIIKFSQDIFLNEEDKYESEDGKIWCIGERVMHIKNNYSVNLMNGCEGKIVSINEQGIRVKYDSEFFLYKYKQKKTEEDDYEEDVNNLNTTMLEHSFCKTIHKSQGSEYEIVILYIPENIGSLSNINLFYTAITRAKKKLYIVGNKRDIMKTTIIPLPDTYDNLHKLI